MMGQRIESRPDFPWASLAVASIGLALLGGGLALGRSPLAIAAALPIGVALALLVSGRERPFAAVFVRDAMDVEDPPVTIYYSSLNDVRSGGIPHDPSTFRKASAAIQVEHEGGTLSIPARLNLPSHEVYRFLAGRMSPGGARIVNPVLAEYLERQEGYFGPEQVYSYRATPRGSRRGRYRRLRAFCVGLMLAGASWMVAGVAGWAETGWGWAGVLATLIGLCFLLVTLAEDNGAGRLIKNWRKSSLVIGPQGMAMVQGDIQGEVRWPELLEVQFKPKASAFRLSYAHGLNGIILKVKGADILIADIYDRPLYLIHERILASSGRSTPEEVVDL
jgi:hypothetical protein